MTDWRKADLHIHSALSPCAEDEMTPNNIVNMAALLGLSVIAVTDHQAAENVAVVAQLAEARGMICLPGMEVQTKEEVHLLAYFPELGELLCFAEHVRRSLIASLRPSAFFGRQLILDCHDQISGEYPILLQQSAALSVEQVYGLVDELGGCCVPAHLDRQAFSLLSQLGFLPRNLPIATVEYTQSYYQRFRSGSHSEGRLAITSSDAHSLGQMITLGNSWLHARLDSPQEICQALRRGDERSVQSYRPNFD